jgi:hypothetical protein
MSLLVAPPSSDPTPSSSTNNNEDGHTTTTSTNNNSNSNSSSGTGAILARLKELESANVQLQRAAEEAQQEAVRKEERIKALSADKRKEMEELIETAIDTWLKSLTNVPDVVRDQFRQGVVKIAEQADMNNAAWEIVCNASMAHKANVHKIDELMQTITDQGETIKSLVGSGGGGHTTNAFASEAARIAGFKRPREKEVAAVAATAVAVPTPANEARNHHSNDVWDSFADMIKTNSSATYY